MRPVVGVEEEDVHTRFFYWWFGFGLFWVCCFRFFVMQSIFGIGWTAIGRRGNLNFDPQFVHESLHSAQFTRNGIQPIDILGIERTLRSRSPFVVGDDALSEYPREGIVVWCVVTVAGAAESLDVDVDQREEERRRCYACDDAKGRHGRFRLFWKLDGR